MIKLIVTQFYFSLKDKQISISFRYPKSKEVHSHKICIIHFWGWMVQNDFTGILGNVWFNKKVISYGYDILTVDILELQKVYTLPEQKLILERYLGQSITALGLTPATN